MTRSQIFATSEGRLARRLVLTMAAALVPSLLLPGQASAGARKRTPAQSEGPFFPVKMPLQTDADLLHASAGNAVAGGIPLELTGRVLDRDGGPVAGAKLEIWQCDHQGIYKHPGAGDQDRFDPAFQGYGASRTGAAGNYRFLTIRPVPYTGRTPHIHVTIRARGHAPLTTQIYLKGHPQNTGDFLFNHLRPGQRDRLLIDPKLAAAPAIAGLETATFDFVL